MIASASSGTISETIGAPLLASGATPLMAKQMLAATQSDSAGATVLNAMRERRSRRRHEIIRLSAATASAAGPGPNITAVVMKNVSATEMLAEIAAKFSLNEPATIAI